MAFLIRLIFGPFNPAQNGPFSPALTFERELYHRNIFDAYFFVSRDDENTFNTLINKNRKPTTVVPIGNEDHKISVINKFNENAIIVGKMSYPPNIEGVIWFVKNVWPLVTKKCGSAKLFIVGKDPADSIRELESNSVQVTGTVDSVEPYYRNASVAIVPLFSGGGVKTKLIEATSYNIPTVCTKFGAVGTCYENNKDMVITDDVTSFAEAVISSLKGDSFPNEMAEHAHKKFMENYNWKGICIHLNNFLNGICKIGD